MGRRDGRPRLAVRLGCLGSGSGLNPTIPDQALQPALEVAEATRTVHLPICLVRSTPSRARSSLSHHPILFPPLFPRCSRTGSGSSRSRPTRGCSTTVRARTTPTKTPGSCSSSTSSVRCARACRRARTSPRTCTCADLHRLRCVLCPALSFGCLVPVLAPARFHCSIISAWESGWWWRHRASLVFESADTPSSRLRPT